MRSKVMLSRSEQKNRQGPGHRTFSVQANLKARGRQEGQGLVLLEVDCSRRSWLVNFSHAFCKGVGT